jgi:hypothetical protein
VGKVMQFAVCVAFCGDIIELAQGTARMAGLVASKRRRRTVAQLLTRPRYSVIKSRSDSVRSLFRPMK